MARFEIAILPLLVLIREGARPASPAKLYSLRSPSLRLGLSVTILRARAKALLAGGTRERGSHSATAITAPIPDALLTGLVAALGPACPFGSLTGALNERPLTAQEGESGPVPDRRTTFTIVVEAQKMVVEYKPNWMADMGQLIFRSPHKPPRRIPVSETGYRNYFAAMEDVKASPTPKEFAREVALELMRSRRRTKEDDSNQLPLF
ncbi:hypothetical protein [Bradyrhizobium genosp. A]|uniref:hypothetical protein n=1 Tax=Bradyrhizobium genosp. A TaxID=83626 RepID=UPI003CE8CE05